MQSEEIDRGTVAAVDAQEVESEALSAVAAAETVDEIEQARVEYLGRKSALKLALREVRDRETGMTLNALRERIESAIDAREEELRRAELDRRLTEERVDVTMPGDGRPARAPPPHHADPARVRGHLPRARLHGRRRSRGRDDPLQLRRAQLPGGPSVALAAADALPRRRDGPAHRDVAVADPDDGGAGAARLHRLARARVPAGHARCDPHADLPPGGGPRRRRGDHARRPPRDARLPVQGALRREPRDRFSDPPLPVHGAVGRGATSRVTCATGRAARCAGTRAGSRSAAPGWSTRTSSSSSATTRSATPASRSAGASSGSPCSATGSRTCASSGATTRDSSGSSDARPALLARRLRHRRRDAGGDRAQARDLVARRSSGSSTSASPTWTATSAASSSAACSRSRRTRTPTGCASARSTWGRATRVRSSAAPGTSRRGRRSRSRFPARTSRSSTCRSTSASFAARPRGG